VVTEGGFHEAPVAAIAALAGVATGTVYRYFPRRRSSSPRSWTAPRRRELDIIVSIVESGGHRTCGSPMRSALSRAVRCAAGGWLTPWWPSR